MHELVPLQLFLRESKELMVDARKVTRLKIWNWKKFLEIITKLFHAKVLSGSLRLPNSSMLRFYEAVFGSKIDKLFHAKVLFGSLRLPNCSMLRFYEAVFGSNIDKLFHAKVLFGSSWKMCLRNWWNIIKCSKKEVVGQYIYIYAGHTFSAHVILLFKQVL